MNQNMVAIGTYQKWSLKVTVSCNEKQEAFVCFFNNIFVLIFWCSYSNLLIDEYNKSIDLKVCRFNVFNPIT